MSSITVTIAYIEDEAWVKLVVDGLDGHRVRSERWPPASSDPSDLLLVVCTPGARAELEGVLEGLSQERKVAAILREGTPDTSIPWQLRERPCIDLREGASLVSAIDRISRVAAGEPLSDPRPTPAEMERHVTDLAHREGANVAGWSAVTWADDAKQSCDFATEWVMRRLAAELLRASGEAKEALVQARQGLAAALITNASRGIDTHDRLIADLEADDRASAEL